MRFTKMLSSIAAAALAAGGLTAQAQVVVGPDGNGGWNAYQRIGTSIAWDEAWDNAKSTTFPGYSINGVEVLPASDDTAHLVTIPSAEVNTFVFSSLGTGWIGLTDNDIPDELFDLGAYEAGNTSGSPLPAAGQAPGVGERGEGFVWVDGSPFTYQNWNGGEPNDASGEDAIEIIAGGLWNDLRVGGTFGDQPSAGHERAPIIEWDFGLTENPVAFELNLSRGANGLLQGTIAAQATASGEAIPGVSYQVYERRVVDKNAVLGLVPGETRPGLFVEIYDRGNSGNGDFFRDTPLPQGDWSNPSPTPRGFFSAGDGEMVWENGNSTYPYPQVLQEAANFPPNAGNVENYSTRMTGEIFLEQGTTYYFRDGIDDYALLQIDTDLDGTFDPTFETFIDDNSWTNVTGVNNGFGGVVPGTEIPVTVDADGWYPILFGGAEGGGGDSMNLMWDQDTGGSPNPAFDIDGFNFYTVEEALLRHTLPDVLPTNEEVILTPYGYDLGDGEFFGMFGNESLGEVGGDPVPLPGSFNFNDNQDHELLIRAQIGSISDEQVLMLSAVPPGVGGDNCPPLGPQGDVNCDGAIDLVDFNLLKANFGASAEAAAVPEPSTLALLGLGGLAALAFSRRRGVLAGLVAALMAVCGTAASAQTIEVNVSRNANGLLEGVIASDAGDVSYEIYEFVADKNELLGLVPGETRPGLFVEIYDRGNSGNGDFFRDTPLPAGDWSNPSPMPRGYFSAGDGEMVWENGNTTYPYPQVLQDAANFPPNAGNVENYSTRMTGEIFLEGGKTYYFRDGIDDYAILQIDTDLDGTFDPTFETFIDDNAWTDVTGVNNGNGGVAPGAELPVFVDEDGWYPILFGGAEGGGGDSMNLMWDQDTGGSPNPAFDIGGFLNYTVEEAFLRHTIPDVLPSARELMAYGADLGAAGYLNMFGGENVGEVGGATGLVPRSLNFNDGQDHRLLIQARVDGMMAEQILELAAVHPGGPGDCDSPLFGSGDINCDSTIDLVDFNILKANFGASGAAAVPEPSTLALLGLGGVAALALVRRRK